MRGAMALLREHGPAKATEAIQRALHANVADKMYDVDSHQTGQGASLPSFANTANERFAFGAAEECVDVEDLGHVSTHRYSNAAGSRKYRLYVPPRENDDALPLIVMLHGCTQSADDFAAGTQMDALAQRHRCLVAYPEQPAQANPSKCWNWFKPEDQTRESGEASLIVGIAREIASTLNVDRDRVFIAGLSAGGAMAANIVDAYPDVFAAAGVHSGLPARCAHDLPSALAAMKGGRHPWMGRAGHETHAPRRPMIVFHGDADTTVNVANAMRIAQGFDARLDIDGGIRAQKAGNRASKASRIISSNGIDAELWIVHGAGHAWSGGNAQGTFTDPRGPDASAEMLRFFLEHPKES
ncbi:polyhydroxybutyrate depolymerase (plasmid) [Pararobbsia alpina]